MSYNELLNPSFEDGTATAITEWAKELPSGVTASHYVETADIFEGARAAGIDVTLNPTASIVAWRQRLLKSQLFPNHKYQLQFRYKASVGANVRIVIQLLDATNTQVPGYRAVVDLIGTGAWELSSLLELTTPEAASAEWLALDRMRIAAGLTTTGTVILDAAELVIVLNAGEAILVLNSDPSGVTFIQPAVAKTPYRTIVPTGTPIIVQCPDTLT